MASELLERSRLGSSGRASSFRLGITGPPGVGKSTLTEALGMHILTESSREDGEFMPINLAVLAIDPSSTTGGSILGDKTRMAGLSCHPRAFVRPSPSSGSLGGMQVGNLLFLCSCFFHFPLNLPWDNRNQKLGLHSRCPAAL